MSFIENVLDELEAYGGFYINFNEIKESPRFFKIPTEYEVFRIQPIDMIKRIEELFSSEIEQIKIKIIDRIDSETYDLLIIGITEV